MLKFLASQISLDLVVGLKDLADLAEIVFGQVVSSYVVADASFIENLSRI